MYSTTKLVKPIDLEQVEEVANGEVEEASHKRHKTLNEQSPFYVDAVAILKKVKAAVKGQSKKKNKVAIPNSDRNK